MTVGRGTASGKKLMGYLVEIEAFRERKKQIGEQEKATFGQAKADGFDTKTMRKVLTLRSQEVSSRQQQQTLLDTYMHAIGMAEEPPLFAALGKFHVDFAAREQAVEFLKQIVPPTGEIILNIGAIPVRIFRDADGNAQAEEVGEVKESIEKRKYPHVDGEFTPPPKVDRVKEAADRAERAAARK